MAASLNSTSNLPLDIWDTQTDTKQKTPAAVRDDWEDDDEDETDVIEDARRKEDASSSHNDSPEFNAGENVNKKIWEAANRKNATPMPALLSSRTGSVIPPPAAAFQPTMRILKRPASSSPSQGSPVTSPPPQGETIRDREARYVAARERIFGSEYSESAVTSVRPVNSVAIIREPRAPNTEPGEQGQQTGFKGRGGKAISSSRPFVDS